MRKNLIYILIIFVLGVAFYSHGALAKECPEGATCLIVDIPGVKELAGGAVTNPAQYIVGIYRFSLGIGGLMAMGIIVFAGIKRIVSAGNTAAISDANDMIKNAVLGLVLLLGAFLILNTISPRLTQLQLKPPPGVKSAGNVFANIASDAQSLASRTAAIQQRLEKQAEKQRELIIAEEKAVAAIQSAKTEEEKLAAVVEANKILAQKFLNTSEGHSDLASKLTIELNTRDVQGKVTKEVRDVTNESIKRNQADAAADLKQYQNLLKVIKEDEQKLKALQGIQTETSIGPIAPQEIPAI